MPGDSDLPLRKSTFSIPKMDCPSEENLIRMACRDLQDIRSLSFDLKKREVTAVHENDPDDILERLEPLNLGAVLRHSEQEFASEIAASKDGQDTAEAKVLLLLLAINALMFFFELTLGLFAESTGLIADSLDMLADAAVYGLALYAVGRTAAMKTHAAHLAGWLQLLLAVVPCPRSFVAFSHCLDGNCSTKSTTCCAASAQNTQLLFSGYLVIPQRP